MSADLESELAALGARWNETVLHVSASEVFGDDEPFMFDRVIRLPYGHTESRTARRSWLVAAAAGVLLVVLVGALTFRSENRSDELSQPVQVGSAGTWNIDDSITTLEAIPLAPRVPLELDRGFADGLLTGMPVVNAAGLVGRLATVTTDRSVVMLVTDTTTFVVGARVVDAATGLSTTTGAIEGQGAGMPLRFRTLSADTTQPAPGVNVGDVVVSAGGNDSLAPAGIPIGTIIAKETSTGDISADFEVEPFVDEVPERFVRILLYRPYP